MSDTSVQTAPGTPAPAAPAVTAPPGKPDVTARPAWTPGRALRTLASLRLTVFLFVLSLLLVFFGTLAQIDNGVWTVVERYFRSAVVWVPVQLLVHFGQVFFGLPRDLKVNVSFPFPGGWLIGSVLLVNLIAAHAVRFRLTWNRSGILVLHFGLILMMLGELVTGLFAVESRMSIAKGETVNFVDVSQSNELAITTPDPDDPSKDKVVVIPEKLLRTPGRISNEQLPFDVEVIDYWKNSNITTTSPNAPHARRNLTDASAYVVTREGESSGVDTEAREDFPTVKVAFYRKGTDEKLGVSDDQAVSKEVLLSLWYYPNMVRRTIEFPPLQVHLDKTVYTVELRPKRVYKPYAITLKQFTHALYPGTTTPKDFSSLIDLVGENEERREVKIYMNNPLRYSGETFFQSGYFPDNSGTVLQVVRNPGWLLPYLSCTLVTLGMVMHFGQALITFLSRRAAS